MYYCEVYLFLERGNIIYKIGHVLVQLVNFGLLGADGGAKFADKNLQR